MPTATVQLRKLALKRDSSVPVGQPAPLHVDCPCGQAVPIVGDRNRCACGLTVEGFGWIVSTSTLDSIRLDNGYIGNSLKDLRCQR